MLHIPIRRAAALAPGRPAAALLAARPRRRARRARRRRRRPTSHRRPSPSTEVSGTYSQRDQGRRQQPRRQARRRRPRSPRAGSTRATTPADGRDARPRRSAPATYRVEWTTLADDGDIGTRHLDLHGRRRRPPTPSPSPERPDRDADGRPPRRAEPRRAVGDGTAAGAATPRSSSRCPDARAHRLDGSATGRAAVTSSCRSSSPSSSSPPGRPTSSRRRGHARPTRRDPRAARSPRDAAQRRLGRGRSGFALVLPATVAAHTLNATYTSRLPLAVYLVGAAPTVALSFVFVIVRDVRAAPPDLTATGHLPPALAPPRPAGHRPVRLGLDHRPGDRRRLERRRRRDALPVGLRLGRAGDRLRARSGRRGTSSTRSRRSTTSARRSCARLRVQGWAIADYPDRLGRWPATIGLRRLRLARAGRPGGAVDAVHRARRLHRASRWR